MRLRPSIALTGIAALAVAGLCSTALSRAADAARPDTGGVQAVATVQSLPARAGFAMAYRRLTESQYRHAVRDAFGSGVTINARFEPERREEGLQAVGAARLSITTSGLEQYQSVARAIADQVVDGKDRDALIGCTPGAAGANGAACAEQFIRQKGEVLFRRPLTPGEVKSFTAIWSESARQYGDFHKGLKLALVGMLMSPDFLFRVEKAESDPQGSALRLEGYTKASRLSYLLWDTGPDAALMEAARTGDIHTPAGMARQVDRLLASPRFEDGVRAFFTDMMEFEAFDTLSKDGETYPKFSQAVADSAREETLKFFVDQLVKRNGDYRDIFTSRDTQIDRTLAYVYNVPYLSPAKWSPYTFSADSERSGVLTQATFLSLFAHPSASSPTIRGVKLSSIFLCVQIPDPPADVDFSKVQALEKGTVRERLIDHMTNPGCAGCHRITDPVGLALERFDGLGQHRIMENAKLIDVSADIGGKKFAGAQGLGQYLHDNAQAPTCLVRKVHYYGVGRTQDAADADYLKRQVAAFAAGGYKMPALFRSMLADPQFYRVITPTGVKSGAQTASLNPSSRVHDHTVSGDAQ